MRAVAAVAALCLLAACSGDDGAAVSTTTSDPAATPSTASTTSTAPSTAPDRVPSTSPATSGPASTEATPTTTSATTTIVAVPETGIPGLDSDDVFCAAWSRFGGTWQVLLVGSTFLDDPERVAEWEVAASGLVARAYDDLVASFPAELAAEAEGAADGYFGVFARRARAAGDALAAAGASAGDVDRLGEAWLDALATRDPSSPGVAFEVPDGLGGLVASAAADLRATRVEFHLDPSMVVGVETPLTDVYLETACPDQGTLVGSEIDP